MRKRQYKKEFLAQNFLKSPLLVRSLVEASSIGRNDTVIEIGAGKGIITNELARVAKRVIAVEKDKRLVNRLRDRFRGCSNVEIVETDILRFRFPDRSCKIFASIPYNITAAIARKILTSRTVNEAYLIMQREPARKFAGQPRETFFSVTAKPFFEFEIITELRRSDFFPAPNVDSVLLVVRRRRSELLDCENILHFHDFVELGFKSWKPHLRSAFKKVFSYKQWKRLSLELSFRINSTPTDLSAEQWMRLFNEFQLLMREKRSATSQISQERNYRDQCEGDSRHDQPRSGRSRGQREHSEIVIHGQRSERDRNREARNCRSRKRGPPFKKKRGKTKNCKWKSNPANKQDEEN